MQRARGFGQVPGDQRLRGRRGEGLLAGDHLVQHAAEGVDVAPAVHLTAAGLLRAHVGGGAEGEAGLGELSHARDLEGAGHAEVGHPGVSAAQEDVLGLDVAVDHSAPVGAVEGVGDFPGQADGLLQRELPPLLEPVAQRLALDPGHGVPEEPAGIAGVEHRQDVGVVEAGGDPDLAEEPLGAEAGGQLGAHELDGDRALVPEVAGAVDRGHPALAELLLDLVAVTERVREAGAGWVHEAAWRG